MIRLILAFVVAPLLAFLLGEVAASLWVAPPGSPGYNFQLYVFWVYGVMLMLSLPGLVLLFWRGGGGCLQMISWGSAASLLMWVRYPSMSGALLCFVLLVGPLMAAILWFFAFFWNDALASYLPQAGEQLGGAGRGAVDILWALTAAALCAPSLSWMMGDPSHSTGFAVFLVSVLFLPAVVVFLLGPWRWFQAGAVLVLGALQLLESIDGVTMTSQLHHEGTDLGFMFIRVIGLLGSLFVLVLVIAGQRAERRRAKRFTSPAQRSAQHGRLRWTTSAWPAAAPERRC